MRNMFAIMRKELRTYFVSPVAYVVIAAYLAMSGILFALLVLSQSGNAVASLDVVFGNISVILLLVAPALTMRLLAEEQRSGSIEILLTSPVQDWEVVLGKYFASLILFLAPVAMTLVYVLVLMHYGSPDMGPLVGGYIGLILFGAAFLAVGMFATSLTQNQVVAALIAVVILIVLWLAGAFASSARAPVSTVLSYISLTSHYSEFAQGMIDTKNVVYYLCVIATSLFLSVRALETRRWT
jgi:ABC-2 type transport system permease protein